MSKKKIFSFLKDLSNNNSKEWMDANRTRYKEAKQIWLDEVALILQRLSKYDALMEQIEPKTTMMRINNNRRFHPDLPVYRDYFTCSPTQGDHTTGIHISISPMDSFIGGGAYRPDNATLKKIRSAIDYDADELLQIINEKSFTSIFGGLHPDDQALKSAPRGFAIDHPHIELLRRKNFVGIRPLTQKEIISSAFVDIIEEAYVALMPLVSWLDKVIHFEE